MVTCTKPTEERSQQPSILGGGRAHEAPPITERLLTVSGDWGEGCGFPQWYSPGSSNLPVILMQATLIKLSRSHTQKDVKVSEWGGFGKKNGFSRISKNNKTREVNMEAQKIQNRLTTPGQN